MIADVRSSSTLRSTSLGVFDIGLILRRLDWLLLLAVGTLVGYGLWAIAGITRFDVAGNPGYFVTRQEIAAAVGVAGLVVAILIPTSVYRRHWRFIYGTTIGVMVFVFVFAAAVRGSKRWIDVGPFQFQPSEFGKLFFVLAIAGFLVERGRRVGELGTVATAVGLGVVPMALVFLQPDLGTALVYAAALTAVLFLSGVRWLHLIVLAVSVIVLVTSVLWLLPAAGVPVLKPYQTARLTGFANPGSDPGGLNYNTTQSRTAVGAGGISGRGVLGASQTRLDYLPEHATDFVFASFAEQRGFVGTSILLLLYLLVVWRGLRVVTVAGDLYGAVVAGGIVFAFLFQVFINVGMTMGIAPVTGIPLPFVTVGGSSMVANLLAVGVLQSIHARGSARRASLMLFGIGIRDVVSVVRGTRALEDENARIAISGPGSRELAAGLAAGGDRAAVRVDGDPLRAGIAVRLVDDDPSADELATLRRVSRAGVPLVVVRRGGTGRIPYVLPVDIVAADSSIADVAAAIARVAPASAAALAARLPVLRPAATRRLIGTTALANAAVAASTRSGQAHLPVLTLAQSRMVLLLGLSRGESLPRDPQALAVAAAPAFVGSLGVGLVGRALVRRSPIRGPIVRAAVAYAGTRVLGAARLRL